MTAYHKGYLTYSNGNIVWRYTDEIYVEKIKNPGTEFMTLDPRQGSRAKFAEIDDYTIDFGFSISQNTFSARNIQKNQNSILSFQAKDDIFIGVLLKNDKGNFTKIGTQLTYRGKTDFEKDNYFIFLVRVQKVYKGVFCGFSDHG
jgi:hypothetical protein